MNTHSPGSYLCSLDQAEQTLRSFLSPVHGRKDRLEGSAEKNRLWLLVPAAGVGARSGLSLPKQYFPIQGQTVLQRCLVALGKGCEQINAFVCIVVVLSPDDRHWLQSGLDEGLQATLGPRFPLIALKIGGAERAQSVLAGLEALENALGVAVQNDWIMVHDAARPFITSSAIARLWQQGQCDDGALLALPVADTLKRAQSPEDSANARFTNAALAPQVLETVPRERLWRAQTPQLFRHGRLQQALMSQPLATDESLAMEALGYRPRLVMGEASNIKLTFEQDFEKDATAMPDPLNPVKGNGSEPPMRIGQGFDVHALVKGRPLILGGVRVAHETGLLGHSDADVLLHAISDALLGALGLGDIGRHFPDTDNAYKNIDSRVLLRQVVQTIEQRGFRVAQIDATVIAQRPKLMPYIDAMVANIVEDCRCEYVNVKATTTEKLGFTGREEGIAAQAVASLVRMA